MSRPIDHLVLAVRDLDAAADLYRRLGFEVGARNRHPWGTLNHIVQLDGAFLELISTEPGFDAPAADAPAAPFACFLHRYLAEREGLAMLVLATADAAGDHAAFARAGIGIGADAPFHFARQGRRPDGSEVRVAFTLAFAATPLVPGAGFFVCQHHYPESFWNAALQRHANTATAVTGVVLAAAEPAAVAPFVSAFAGAAAEVRGPSARIGAVAILTPAEAHARLAGSLSLADGETPRLVACRLACRDLGAARAALAAGGIPVIAHVDRLVVPASAAMGVALVLEPAAREAA